jgi:hypothetical protein
MSSQKTCLKCRKNWAMPGSNYCTVHAGRDNVPRVRRPRPPRTPLDAPEPAKGHPITTGKIDASKIRVSDIEVGHLALLMIDLKTGRQWTEHKYSDEWLAKYGRTHG